MSEYVSNENFYNGIDKEYEKQQIKNYVECMLKQFDELCIKENYTVEFIYSNKSNRFMCTLKIKDSKNFIIWWHSSVSNSKINSKTECIISFLNKYLNFEETNQIKKYIYSK